MNNETIKALSIIEMTSIFTEILKRHVENELEFLAYLHMLLTKHTEIDTSKVDGNELYVIFCDEIGNEQEGWK